MKLARPQLRHLRGTVDSSDNSSSNSNNKNSSSKMPPSFADLTSAEAVKSKSDSNSGHRSKKSKKKEKSTHKRHSSSNDATFSSNNKPSRSSHRTSASTLPTIYAGNRESLNNVDTPSQQLDRSTNSSSACSSNNDLKMPAITAMTETEKAQHRRRSEQQDAFVPAQLNVKSKKNKKKSSPSVSSSSNSHRKSSKKKSTLSSKTSSTLTTETNTEWEDLGDEIATALHKSLGVGDDDDDDEVSNTNDKKQKKGDKQQHRHLEEDIDLPPWKCPACTFKNEPLHLVCAVCGTAAAAVAASLTKSLTSSASSHNQQQLRSSHLSSSFQANNAIPSSSLRSSTHTHHHRYGSSENLNNSTNAEFRRSTFEGGRRHGSSEDFNRYYNDSSSNNHNGSYNNSYNANSGGEYPDPHTSHRRMSNGTAGRSGRYSMDDMSNDSEGLSYNIQDQVDYQDHYHSQRRRSRDYYGRNSFDRRDTRGGGDRGEGGGRSRGFSQSMQIVGSGGGGGSHYGGGSVGSDRRKQQYKRSRRRTDHFYDDDSKDLASKNSRDEYRMSTKDFRKSTMMDMDYGPPRYDRERSGGSSIGRYRGSGGGRHRDDYSDASESFGTKGRITGGQYYDDGGSIISEMSDDEGTYAERTVRTMQTIKKMVIPSGEVTIIYTDVQGSTALWEADPMSMKKATDIHDSIIRRCYSDHGGYEITTEGDAFNLAFQHPADAIGFALKAQLALYRAKWPEGTLNHPDGCDNEKKKFRGFRVRFGMHHGPTTSTVHKTTGRTTYQGEAVEVAKAIEKMSHGGQILTTVETWRTVSGMAEQLLGSPQVMDCGEHLLWDPKKSDLAKKKSSSKKVLSKRIVQLVPNSLSYDFFAARGGQEVKEGETPQKVCGRVFPPLLSHGQLSTSFLNAPYIGNKVAMVFVYTDKMEAIGDRERKKNYKILAKYVRSHLMRLSPPGYECQEDKGSWMLAFDRIDNGINFGLDLKENVMKNAKLLGEVDKSKVFRVGIHWGPFLSMGPHTVTGHADYFGPIVNRAARVAAQCEAGQICVGVPMGTEEEPPDPGPTVEVDVLGVKQLKGISIEMAIFACRKKEKEEESQEQE